MSNRPMLKRALALLLALGPFSACSCEDSGFTDALLRIDPPSIDFGPVTQGRTSTRALTLSNIGGKSLSFELTNSNPDFVLSPPSGLIAAGSAVTVEVAYTPSTLEDDADFVEAQVEGVAPPDVILTGQGVENADPMASATCIAFEGGQPSSCRILNLGTASTEPISRELTFRNDDFALGALDLLSLEAIGPGFSVSGPETLPVSLAAGEDVTLTVTFDPTQAGGSVTGCVLIRSNDPLEAPAGTEGCQATGFNDYRNPWQVNLLAEAGGARADICTQVSQDDATQECVPPHDIDFGEVADGETPVQKLWIRNGGSVDLTVSAIDLDASSSSAFSLSPSTTLPATLPPQSEMSVDVTYTPGGNPVDLGTIRITSTDPGSPTLTVGLTAGSPPQIDVNPFAYSFVDVPQGSEDSVEVTITSVGFSPLTVSSIDLFMSNPDFALRALPTLPATLAPGEAATFEVVYDNQMVGDATGTVRIGSDDPASPLFEMTLLGTSLNNLPPVADAGDDITLFGYDFDNPQTLTLDGSGSSDDMNLIGEYRWTLVRVPRLSTATLSAETGQTTTIAPDAPGLYIVGLVVTDDLNQQSIRDDVNISVQE